MYQKTDFRDMTSESNAIVEAKAGQEIIFAPGTHLKAGTTFIPILNWTCVMVR